VHPGGVFEDVVRALAHVLHQVGRLAADLALDGGVLWDDVGRGAALDDAGVDAGGTGLVPGMA